MNERPKNAENARITEKQQTRKYRFHSALCDDATTISINKQHRTTTAQVQKKNKKKTITVFNFKHQFRFKSQITLRYGLPLN